MAVSAKMSFAVLSAVFVFSVAMAATISPVTDTTPQVDERPLRCFDCHSGRQPLTWENPACSVEGYISREWDQTRLCNGQCYSKVGLFPAGSVHRGCTSYFSEFGFEVPVEGCVNDAANNQYWCFCSTHECNTHNLTAKADEYVKEYSSMMAQKETNVV